MAKRGFVLLVWHKLVIVGLIATVLCMVPTGLYVRVANQEIRAAMNELSGLRPTTELLTLTRLLQDHRGISAAMLGGDPAAGKQRGERESNVNAQFGKVREMLPTALHPQFEEVEKSWSSITHLLKKPSPPMEENLKLHGKVINEAIDHLEAVIDHFGLVRDPETATSHLINMAYSDMPVLIELLAQVREVGGGMLNFKQAGAEERTLVASHLERARHEIQRSRLNLRKADAARGGKLDKLRAVSDAAHEHARRFEQVSSLELVRIENLRYDEKAFRGLVNTAIDAQYQLIDAARAEIERQLTERIAERRFTMTLLLTMIGCLLLIGTLTLWWMARSIVRPLGLAMGDAEAIAGGRLDREPRDISADEVGKVRRAMRHMQDNLKQIVLTIRENSETVAIASSEIAASTRNMSARAESQAASLEETAASMEQMNATVQRNDQASQRANELAASAALAAARGGDVVGKVTGTMRLIETSSKRIGEIIGVIDTIAFQTNILALNAAVEAARAGEQGRGFAVVAAEVRALAQRSGQAAKEIRALISESVTQVQTGAHEAADAGQAMQEILDAARKVERTMRDMRVSSEEQMRGIAQVSRAVEQMNQGTQQSAAMVEEISATAEQLAGQAQELTRAVAAFVLPERQVFRPENAMPAAMPLLVAS